MNKLISNVFIVCLLVTAIGYVYTERNRTSPMEMTANPLFKLKLLDSNSRPYDMSNLEGKIAVVNFWATYCGPCRDEMPDLSAINDDYQDKGVIVLGVAADAEDNVTDFLESTKVSYRNVIAEFDAIDQSNLLGNESSVLPYTVIFDQNGKVLERHAGRIKANKIREILDLALARK